MQSALQESPRQDHQIYGHANHVVRNSERKPCENDILATLLWKERKQKFALLKPGLRNYEVKMLQVQTELRLHIVPSTHPSL